MIWQALRWLSPLALFAWCAAASQAQVPAPAAPAASAVMDLLRQAAPKVVPFSADEIDRVQAGKGLTDCFWVGTVSPSTFNILSPDLAVTYWISQFRLPAGAKLVLKGEYPRARYMSFASYNPQGQPVDGLADDAIAPDAGSVNPFRPGAQRLATPRQFTVTVQARSLQAGVRVDEATRPANTIFVPTDEPTYQLWLRVYAPDAGLGPLGGAKLPRPVMTLADGSQVDGNALCRGYVVKDRAVRDFRASKAGNQAVFAVPGAKAPYHPAQPVPRWNGFYNPLLTMASVLINTPFEEARSRMDATRRSGFYGTLDNYYMSAYVDDRYGELLVIQGKAPRTPHTLQGNPVMDANVDLRYWSFCKGRSIHDGAVDACLMDEQVPQDANQRYTLVVSTPANRPANARAECGVAWLPWGVGDGMDNPHGGYVIHRHMKPSPGFTQSLWATQKPGDEAATLGEYYPVAAYLGKAAFEARGCPVKP
ncbi:MAG TPA: hypothetical protein VLA61_14250 [Ideonella sp.]|uniref:hypothetical protein n=1 Tax=Ideonella sp. TaxID=1929293 RepID=UPI002C497C20|nr:hypothetical protein [Ideonella sp.]HSI49432.1 hypothetical protein [Ideonella sp.]